MHSIACLYAGQPCFTVIGMAERPEFDPASMTPLYVQAADYLAARIAAGGAVATRVTSGFQDRLLSA
jgi:hypothetical protein